MSELLQYKDLLLPFVNLWFLTVGLRKKGNFKKSFGALGNRQEQS